MTSEFAAVGPAEKEKFAVHKPGVARAALRLKSASIDREPTAASRPVSQPANEPNVDPSTADRFFILTYWAE
jgi:hypothetical protein